VLYLDEGHDIQSVKKLSVKAKPESLSGNRDTGLQRQVLYKSLHHSVCVPAVAESDSGPKNSVISPLSHSPESARANLGDRSGALEQQHSVQ
jgi:hypothetical protein